MSRISKPASRVLALLMVVCMLIGMLPVSAFAAEGETLPIETLVEDGSMETVIEDGHDHDHDVIDDEQENIEDEEPVIEDEEPVIENEEPVIEDEEPVVEDKESIIDDEWVITDEADVLDADGDATYTKIDADDIEVGMKIVIVGKGSSNYYALTNGSNQKTSVSVSGDTLTVSGSADALIWTVGTATGSQTDGNNNLKFNFSNNGTYMGRISNENTVTLKGSADANTKYFGHVVESSTIGNYSGRGDYYGLAYSNSQFIYTTGSSNRNISFYEVTEANSGDEDDDDNQNPPAAQVIEITTNKDAASATKNVSIEVGQTATLKLTNASGAEKTHAISNTDSSVASVDASNNFSIAGNGAKEITITGLKNGTTTITFTGTSNGGSTYYAVLNVIVGTGESEGGNEGGGDEGDSTVDPSGSVVVISGSDYQGNSSSTNFNAILNKLKSVYSSVHGMLFAGDTSNSMPTSANDVKAVDDAVNAAFPDIAHKVLVRGNHDNGNNSSLFAGTGAHDTAYYGVYAIDYADLSSATSGLNSYLNGKISAKYTKPIFVVSHQPLHSTGRPGDKNTTSVFNALQDAGEAGLNIFYLFGHNHSSSYDDYLGGSLIYLIKGVDSIKPEGGNTTETLNFTYLNAGYVGYSNSGADQTLAMTVFEITDSQVTVKRYSASGVVNLKVKGTGSNANTKVYESPQYVSLDGTITPPVDPPADPEKPTGSYTYELVTSIENGNKYVIVGNNHPVALMDSNGSIGSQTVSINGNTLTSDVALTEWTISGTSKGSITSDAGHTLGYSNSSWNLSTGGDRTFDIAYNNNNFSLRIVRSSSSNQRYYFSYDGSAWAKPTSASYVRLYKLVENGTTPDVPETPDGDYTKVDTVTNGDYVIVVGEDRGLTNQTGATVSGSNSYAGLKSNKVTISGKTITAGVTDGMIWTVTVNNGKITIQNENGKYLAADYGSSNTGNTRKLLLSNTADANWVYTDGKLNNTAQNTNPSSEQYSGCYLYQTTNTTDYTISVRSLSNASNVAFYKVTSTETDHTHDLKVVRGQAATCTEAGWNDYYECECGAYFSDAAGENEIPNLDAWKTGAGKIAAKDHAWGAAAYTFAENGKSCTAQRVCGNDATHVENATATISSKVKTPATCTEKGTTTYTATFAETWAATQTKDVQDIAAKDHAWGEATYAFAENGKSCTAQRVCGNDATHVENATATISSKVKTPATCTVKGTTTYTATFTETWAATQTKDVQDIAVIPHSYDTTTWKKDDKNHWHECSVCGDKTDVAEHKSNAAATETAPEVCAACGYEMNPALSHTHDWVVTYTFAEDGSACTAKRVCSKDATHIEEATAEITSAVKTPATCEDKGTTTYTATFTESWAATQTLDVEDIAAKNHAWTVTYNFAADGKSCTATHVCGNDAEHNETATATISSAVKTPATCEDKGTTTYTATFTEDWAATQTLDVEDIAAKNHAWTVTYNFAADGKSCTATHVCGNDAEHNETATATISSAVKTPATCEEMGTTTYTATFSVSWAATQTKDVQDIATVDHNFEDGECTVCGEPDPDFGEPAYKQIAASDIKVNDKIIIVGKSGSSYYALTNGSNQRTAVTVSGDTVTVSGSADALIWTVGEATGNQIDTANGNDLDYVFSNGSTYFGRVTDSNVVEFQTGSAANTKYFGHDIANSTIGNYSRGGAYYGLLYQDSRFIYVENANNSNASVLFFKAINVVDDDEPTQPEQPSDNPTKVTRLEDGKYVIVSRNNTKALTSTVHNGYTNTNNYGYKGFNGADVTIANNEITAGYTADMVFEITAKSGVTNGYTIKHVPSGKFLTATYTQNSNGGYNGLLTLTDTAEDTWVLDSNFRLKSTKASDNSRGSTLYLTFDDKTDTISSGSGSLFGVRSDSNSFTNVDTIDFYKVNDTVTPEPGTKTLRSIAVTTNPTKMTYTVGEDFRTEGMVVTATYSDGTSATVTGYTLSGDQDLTAGSKTITISYTEGGVTKTTTLTVTVNPAAETEDPTNNPTKVTALEDGNYVIVANNMAMTNVVHNGYTNSSSYSYRGFTGASVTISGNEIVAGATDNMIFEVKAEGNGYTIMQNGKYLSASYTQNSNNSGWTGVLALSDTKDIWTWNSSNGYLKSTNASNATSEKDLYLVFDNVSNNVSSGDQNNMFGIRSDGNNGDNMDRVDFYRVGELKQVSSIRVVTAPSKTEYYSGQNFSSSGMVIEVTYEDGTKANITSGFTVDNGSNLTAGQTSVTISYRGKTTTQAITVTVRPEGAGTTYVAFSSDVHSKTTSTTSGSPARLNSWITTVTDIIDATFDTMTFCGDNAAGDNSAYGDTYWSYVQPVMSVVTSNSGVEGDGIFLNGNHEWQHGDVGTSSNAVAKKIKPVHYVHEGDDYVIYAFGATSQDQSGTGYKTADITTLGNWLANAPADKPIFIASHFPIHSAGNRSTANAATLRSTLNQYADDLDLYFLWGHNHTNANSSENNYDKVITGTLENQPIGFTYMAAGCMSDSEYSGGSAAVEGKGLVAKIVDGQVESLTYYGENGNVVYNYEPDYDDDQGGETTVTLSSIAVTTNPTKMVYTQGENFDPAGMVVTATYSDGSKKVVTDYTVSGGTNMAVGTVGITVSYTEGGVTKNATVNVTVNAPATLVGIAVTTEPTMMVYAIGESFNPAGMVVTATYSDGTTKAVTGYSINGGTNMAIGTNPITISYTEGGVTMVATLNVTVVAAQAVSSIAVTTNPTKMIYTEGESFDPAGMVVTATYADGTSRPVDGYTTANDANMPIGEQTITITYEEGGVSKSTTLVVTVKAPLSGITVNTEEAKMEYADGETFDPSGLVVTANYSDGTSAEVTEYTLEGGEDLKVGENYITVRYQERGVTKTQELVVTVYAVLTDIIVNNDAVKLAYNYGEAFDSTGMVVTAVYSDATTKVLEAEDYTITGGTDMVVGENPITVSYTEKDVTITKEFVVTVTAVLKDIEVNTEAVKLAYNYGEAFDPTGLVVTAVYTDDTTIVLEADDYTVTGGTDMKTGENTITIGYTEGDVTVTKEFVVTVTTVLTGIEVNTDAMKIEYIEGEKFDPTGMVVSATYSDGTTKVLKAEEYTVEGGENMVLGENTITITYTDGEASKTATIKVTVRKKPVEYSVKRVAGETRVETALEVADALKEALGVEKFDTIIIANGEDKNFADALTGSYLATVMKAPILMSRINGLADITKTYIQNNLVSGGTVYLLGGEQAVYADVEDYLIAAGYKVKRLAGNTRYETNLAILDEAGVSNKEILIARGFEFADSLSASATGLPILVVNEITGKLTDKQVEFLQKYKNNTITILGGTAAISEDLEKTIEEIVGKDVDRLAGETREETSAKIAKRYFNAPDFVVAAYSRRCPDGLCGGPLAYAMGAPLLLVNANQERYANAYITENEITAGYVLGGTAVIADNTARAVFGMAEDAVIEMK